ncbi:tail fiber protein, partial [Citrobacter freundii]
MSETVNKIAILSSAVKHALLADVQYYDFHASSAFNRKMKGIITPGIYGGFKPALAGGLNLKITSLQGPGGHGVASVDVNNHQITVQQIEDVTLAIPANGVTRVMLEANYQYGIKTSQVDDSSDIHAARIFTANISVPLADNHLEICRVTVPADATELTLDMIDSSHRQNKALGITLSSEIDSDADHIGASSHAVKKAVKAARDETEKQIEELVDNAPASLDTLKKIADAINNDPDFFNTLNAVLALKAPLHDPALTGIATVPTPPLSVSNKQIANTEFVQAAVAALVGSSPEALDTLAELADALGNDPNFATTMLNKLAGKQPLHEVLTSLSGLNSAANKLAFFNGPNSMALANLTAVGRVLIGQESVAKVLEYLGLVETINKAAGSLQKDQNLSDIPDKAQARNALQLGTAATATL